MNQKDINKERKTFEDLQEEVQKVGLCGRCGGCVSFCTADRLGALKMDEAGRPVYADKDKCLECGLCYLICPQTKELDAEVREKLRWKPPIGPYQTIVSARTTDEGVMEVCTDGGVVTSILMCMHEYHLIEGALVSRKTGIFSRKPVIATTRSDLIRAAGSQFSESAHIEKVGEDYTTYTQMMPAIKGLSMRYFSNLAIVGTPCQIHTIRKMQVLGILPADIIRFTIGLFCMENLSFDAITWGKFAERHHIDMKDVAKLNIKEDLIVTLRSGETLHIPFEEVNEIARPACLACQEFANEYADISVGGLGSPDGYTTTLIRTDLGRKVYRETMRHGFIEERPMKSMQEAQEEKESMLAKVMSFAEMKRRRGERKRREMFARSGGGG